MIVADTGFFVALFHSKDRGHADAMAKLQVFQNSHNPIITTATVVNEVYYLLKNRENFSHQQIQSVMGNFNSYSITVVHPFDDDRVFKAWVQYMNLPNKDVDYTDFHVFVTGLEFGCEAVVASDPKDHQELNGALHKLIAKGQVALSSLAKPAYKELIILCRS
jgi:predicted nucleic acid-binding protein